MRGAGHIHGTLWLDWVKLRKNMETKKKAKEDNMIDSVTDAFKNIKDEIFGKESHKEFEKEHNALADFIDKFCTCTLKDPTTIDIVKSVNIHNCTKSCTKYGPDCRFGAPWFPSLRTIIAIPAEIKFCDPDEAAKKLQDSKDLLERVKIVLKNEELMDNFSKTCEREIEIYVRHKNVILKVKDILDDSESGTTLIWNDIDEIIQNEYHSHFKISPKSKENINLENFQKLYKLHNEILMQIDTNVYYKERLDKILVEAKVDGDSPLKRIENYEDALSIAPKRYSVVVKRDINEIRVNLYNPEWIKCWNGNMDIQPCLDYFGIITYITDYYMKDDSGTLKLIQKVLEKASDEPIKKKLSLVKKHISYT